MTGFHNGFLLVDKPVGPTSHDVVQAARRAIKERRIGHTGTLDPAATGLLLLCIGRATRLQQYLLAWEKTYHGEIRLGWGTTTYDGEGEPLGPRAPCRTSVEPCWRSSRPDSAASSSSSRPLLGQEDRRAQVLRARPRRGAGALRAEARHVQSIELEAAGPDRLGFRMTCSSGTYLRSLAHDIGEALGCGGHLASLAARPHRPLAGGGRGQRGGARQPPARDRPAGVRLPHRRHLPFPEVVLNPTAWATLPTGRRWSCARRRAALRRDPRWPCGTGAASWSVWGLPSTTWRGPEPLTWLPAWSWRSLRAR